MKTVIFIHVLYILINLDANYSNVNGAEQCESSIETRAVLISCPEKDTGCDDDDPLSKATQADEFRILDVKPSEFKKAKADAEREFPNRVTECKRKLIITMKLNNRGKIDCDDGFIVIDHVYDPITRGKARLLSPVIVKLRQEQMVQLYPLQFQKIVNSNPNENIFTKDSGSSFKGCSVDLDNPTCGITTYNGEPVPFSEGFCCPYDPYMNALHDIESDVHERAFLYKDPRLFGHQKNRLSRSKKSTSILLNPDLEKLRAGNPKERRVLAVHEEDDILDEFGQQKVPNYFFELDRQIVCSPDALVKELCSPDNEKEMDPMDMGSGIRIVSDSHEFHDKYQKFSENKRKPTLDRNGTYSDAGRYYMGYNKNYPTDRSSKGMKNEKFRNNLDGENGYMFGPNAHMPRGKKYHVKDVEADDGNLKVFEVLHGKRDPLNSMAVPRQRRKRLTRENEDSAQYLTSNKGRRNKRIFGIGKKKPDSKPDSKVKNKYNRDTDSMTEVVDPPNIKNCSPPVFFFAHDKNLVSTSSGQNDEPANVNQTSQHVPEPEYEEPNEVVTTNSLEKIMLPDLPDPKPIINQPYQSASPPAVQRIRTNNAGTWDVNTKINQGNVFALDLTKNDNEQKEYHNDKIEEIKYESKQWGPEPEARIRKQKLKSKLLQEEQKLKSQKLNNDARLRNNRPNSYRTDERNYEPSREDKVRFNKPKKKPHTEPDLENIMYSNEKKSEKYKTPNRIVGKEMQGERVFHQDNRVGGVQDNGELEILVPDGVHRYRKINIDLKGKQMDLLRDKHFEDEERLNNVGQRARNNQNQHVDSIYERMNQKSGKVTNTQNQRYYEGNSGWKKNYYQQQRYPNVWDGIMNPRPDLSYLWKDERNSRDNIVDLLTYNYPRTLEEDNKYLVSSQNVFFADSKPHRSMRRKEVLEEQLQSDPYYEDGKEDLDKGVLHGMRSKNMEEVRGSGLTGKLNFDEANGKYGYEASYYKEDTGNVRNNGKRFLDGYHYSGGEKFKYERNRRNTGSDLDSGRRLYTSDFDSLLQDENHKLKNTQFVRSRRSADESMRDYRREFRSRQFNEEDLLVHSSGSGDKQCFGDIQKNFEKLKPRTVPETENHEAKLKMNKQRLKQSYNSAPGKYKRDMRYDMRVKKHEGGKREVKGMHEFCEETTTLHTTTTTSRVTTTTPAAPTSKICEAEPSEPECHCLKYSDLWYSVYLIKKPELSQLVGVQVYDKQTSCDGGTNWRDITKGYMIRLGTFLTKAEDEVPTISMTFTPTGPKIAKEEPKFDTDNYRLLIPSHLTDEKKASYYPEFFGGPSEYMLVRKDDISETGSDCNMIGTSFEAFVRQPQRCSRPPGRCLLRQPVDLWREDLEAKIRGKRGKYFLENFGSVSNTSIKSYTNLTGDFLAMDYFGEYTSILEIEVRADGNAVVRQGENAQIPSVYVDSMAPKKTKIVLSVMNLGLTSALFRPRLGECPSNLDPTWCPLEGPLVLIPPQQRHDFKLELSGTLPAKKVRCAVEVLNQNNKKVAKRKIVIKRGDRCICAFYCKCHCMAGMASSPCVELTKEEYNAAGYFGNIPKRNIPSGSASEAFFANLKLVLLATVYGLLLLGILKAVIGLFWRRLGVTGVQVIVGPRTLCQYYERELNCYQVVYDECGFPIHPQTCRTVQVVPIWVEMFLNVFFFFLYLLRVIWILISSIPCCKMFCADCEGCCKVEEPEEITVKTKYKTSNKGSSNYFNYNVMTFSTKKSRTDDMLYSPYKADEDPLEEDDTEFVLEEIKRNNKRHGSI